MGMDVFGKKPTAPEGEYFRRNVWGWRPLAEFIVKMAPDEAAPCKHWHTNDGDGLDAKDAKKLADKLDALILAGEVETYLAQRAKALESLPDLKCAICEGTGVRSDQIGIDHRWPSKIVGALDSDQRPNPRAGQVGSCNACGGSGWQANWATHYHLEANDVVEFSAFVRKSGGFEID